MTREREQQATPREGRAGTGRLAVFSIVVALALAALRCTVDVPLGVDPRSDAADIATDAGAGD